MLGVAVGGDSNALIRVGVRVGDRVEVGLGLGLGLGLGIGLGLGSALALGLGLGLGPGGTEATCVSSRCTPEVAAAVPP